MAIPGVTIASLQKYYPGAASGGMDVIKEVFGEKHWLVTSHDPNTCAIRLSRAFNYGGAPIKAMAGIAAEKGLDGKRYLIRADDFVKYCRKQFGAPDVTRKGSSVADLEGAIRGRPGVLFFRLKKNDLQMSAYGHADIWDGSVVWYNAPVMEKTWQITLWKV